MRLSIINIFFILFMMPIITFANVNAGLINGIWFSTTTFIEQTQVNILAAVQNESLETITGTVQFFVDGNVIGITTFSVLPKKIERISLPYTFTSGVHSVRGKVASTNGNLSILYEELEARSITVAELPPPPPPPTDNPGGGGGGGIGALENIVTSVSNDIIKSVNPVAESIARSLESMRDKLAPRQDNTVIANKGKTETTTKKSTDNLFDVSIEIAGMKNVSLWHRTLAIFSGLGAWLARYWLWVIVFILIIFLWRITKRHRKY